MGKKDKIIVLTAFVILIFGIGRYFLSGKQVQKLEESGKKAIGTVEHVDHRDIIFSYTVGNKRFENEKPVAFVDIEKGERYEVLYLPEDHAESILVYSEPVINDGEYDIIEANKFRELRNGKDIEFKYSYGGKEYQRTQRVGDHVISGKQILVNKENPKIAYLKYKEE